MLSALGQLNSEILTSHYGSTMPHPSVVSNTVRRAAALKRRAISNLHIARGQQHAIEEEVGVTQEAASMRHVSRQTAHNNTICVGPCARVPRSKVREIQTVAKRVKSTDRVVAVRDLTEILKDLPAPTPWTRDNPRLCVATGVHCAAAHFAQSGDVRYAVSACERIKEAQQRVRLAEEVYREAVYTTDFARSVGNAQVREMEVGHFQPSLKGGADKVKLSTRPNIEKFFSMYSLGEVPDTDDIQIALDIASKRFAPRSRERVVRDLWSRWTLS